MKEKDIERNILDYLSYLPECFAWKNHVIRVYDKNKETYRKPKSRYLLVGISDILGFYKKRPLCLEVKTPETKNRLTESQRLFLQIAEEHGAIAGVVTSIKDVEELLKKV